MAWASVRPSVCLSHWCIVSKRCKLGSRSLQCGLPQNSSFSWQNCVPLGKGVSLERERQRKVPLKDVILPLLALIVWKRLQIGIYLLHIITSTGDRIFRSVNIDDLEDVESPKRGLYWICCNFWQQRTFQQWIVTKWLEIDQDTRASKRSTP